MTYRHYRSGISHWRVEDVRLLNMSVNTLSLKNTLYKNQLRLQWSVRIDRINIFHPALLRQNYNITANIPTAWEQRC